MSTLSHALRKACGRIAALFCGASLLALWPLAVLLLRRPAWNSAWQNCRALCAGRLRWIGPRQGAAAGLASSARLHQKLGLQEGGEAELDAQDAQRRGWGFDSALLLRFAWGCALGGARPAVSAQRWPLLGLWIDNLDHSAILQQLAQWWGQPGRHLLAFVNPHCANLASKNPDYRSYLNRADLLLADGSGVLLAGRILGTPMCANSNGTDLFPVLCRFWQARGARLYLLGARKEVVQAVAERLQKEYPGLEIAGWRDGYFSPEQEGQVIANINAAKPDVLLAALGVPLQDVWLARHAQDLQVPLMMGVGGLFDFYSGRIARAPLWLRELGLEWCWRLAQEPGRMWRRYLLGNLSFLLRVLRQRWRQPALRSQASHSRSALATPPVDGLLLCAHSLLRGSAQDPGQLLQNLAGATVLERSVQALLRQGVRHLCVCLDLGRPAFEQILGQGERWGIHISYLQCERKNSWQRIAALNLAPQVWLHAPGCLPQPVLPQQEAQWLLENGEWAGWACISAQALKLGSLYAMPQPAACLPLKGMALRNAFEILQTQGQLLQTAWDVPPQYKQIAPGVWLAPGVRLRADVKVHAPVMIGRHCQIGAGCELGPNLLLGEGSVLEAGVTIHDACLAEGSYVAGGLRLHHVLTRGGQLQDVRSGAMLPLRASDALYASLQQNPDPVRWGERLQAGALLAALRLTGRSAAAAWRPLCERLHEVCAGRRHLIGLPELPPLPASRAHSELRCGALRLSLLEPGLPPVPYLQGTEQARLTDLYGAAAPQRLHLRQLRHLWRQQPE